MTKRILIASTNRHKCAELSTVARRFGIEIVMPADIQLEKGLGPIPEVQENGMTFYENALLKAQAFREWSGLDALGDDSGLQVDILDNRPGIFSARYGGPGLSDHDRIRRLLAEIRETEERLSIKNRRARFYCSLVLCPASGGEPIAADYGLEGEILDEFRGENGFGYDPIVLINDLGKTLAEVDFEVTCTKGFRARAAEKLFSSLPA